MAIRRKVDESVASQVIIGPRGLTNNLGALFESPHNGLKGVLFEVRPLDNGDRVIIAETTRERLTQVLQKIGYQIVEPRDENKNGGDQMPVIQ